MIASVLPLPQRPSPDVVPDVAEISEYNGQVHSQRANASDFSLDEKQWQKARWWRRINRILSIFGLLVIGAIVALVVVGTRKNGSSSPKRTIVTLAVSPT